MIDYIKRLPNNSQTRLDQKLERISSERKLGRERENLEMKERKDERRVLFSKTLSRVKTGSLEKRFVLK